MGQPLTIAQEQCPLKQAHLAIVIYWYPPGGKHAVANGHSALIIDSFNFDLFSHDTYVSWVGDGNDTSKNPFVRRGATSSFYEDTGAWGGIAIGTAGRHVPGSWVALSGLNTQAMTAEWTHISTKQQSHWKLFDKNCATAVARVLKAGGGDNFATKASTQLIWWPTDLIRYASSMGAQVHSTS